MANSQRLRLKELRRLYTLLGECCELGADPAAWREHFVRQLPGVFGGQLGLYWECTLAAAPFEKPFWLRPLALMEYGWPTPADRKPFEEHMKSGRPEDGPHITPDLLHRRFKVFHWSEDLGRSAWLKSEYFNGYVRKAHIDDGIFAHDLMAPGLMRWMFINRALGDRPFTIRDRRLMTLLNVELAQLLGTKLARLGGPSVTDLPPRQRQVLCCLMDGDSEKQVALRLSISRHTVHGYVKQLHERFGVRSRGELLSRCRSFWPVLEWMEAQSGDGTAGD